MISINRDVRKDLEKTVKQARRTAEAGARQAVQQLRVGDGDAPKDLTTDQRALRTRLRAHGRQLGDRRDAKTGTQETARLVQECAYEHWHRMLFARFLAETDLLIEPSSGMAITLDEVQELAREKATDWLELASEYAERMLPQIFRKEDPVLQIALPPETRAELEDLLKGLSESVFEADDSLGWVYQFWQADKKDEINKSEVKIGADELPAVTQLFTEDYMVLFLLHNTLGAWWAGKVLAADQDLAKSATDEVVLRAACKVGDIDWTYLRFTREEAQDGMDGRWRPAADTFEGWPKAAKDITVLDPSMGSGHFLVFALPILVAFRMAEEHLSHEAAIDAVLRDNIFGLEIDPRCTQIAAFNIAFAAWRAVGFRQLPQLNLACSGLAIGVSKSEWLKLAERAAELADPAAKRDIFGLEQNLMTVGISERARNGLERLFELFAMAPWLGSLIDPRRAGGDIFAADFSRLEPLLTPILAAATGDEIIEMAVTARGLAKATELLSRQFTFVVTNVPFLTQIKFSQPLDEFVAENFDSAKANLATAFIARMLYFAPAGATLAFVAPQSWWFLKRYAAFRQSLLKNALFSLLVRLGENAFESPQAGGEMVGLSILSKSAPNPNSSIVTIDVSKKASPHAKSIALNTTVLSEISQLGQSSNSDSTIIFSEISHFQSLEAFCTARFGSSAGDRNRFVRNFWEVLEKNRDVWEYHQTTPSKSLPFAGREEVILWEKERGQMYHLAESVKHLNHKAQQWRSGKPSWGKKGVAVSLMANFPASIYTGEIYDTNCCAIVPDSPDDLPAFWALCSSPEFCRLVQTINQNRKVEVRTLLSIPFDIVRWRAIAADKFPNGLPRPYTSDPTQWIFDGKPNGSDDPLNVAVARLLGYKWPRQNDIIFPDCPALGEDGLDNFANGEGIVCLSAIKGKAPAEQLLSALLAHAFGAEWSAAKLASLLGAAGFTGKTLDDWLRDGFFQQQCDLFSQRPPVWHIWDGRRDGFNALVSYHRLVAPLGEGRRTLEKLIYYYLGDWIDQQRSDQKAGAEGADGRLASAIHLRDELTKILDGEPPYDVFVRWKALHQQPIGWEPDINDGMRINIRPFVVARPLSARGATACILRTTPKNVKWDKDRGKEPSHHKAEYPWFWTWDEKTIDFAGGSEFDGNRWNDLHYSRAVKQAARDHHRASVGGKA